MKKPAPDPPPVEETSETETVVVSPDDGGPVATLTLDKKAQFTKNTSFYQKKVAESHCLNPRHPLYELPIVTMECTTIGEEPYLDYRVPPFMRVKFQKGQVKNGINGVGVEHLFALAAMKLAEWQNGEHACPENAQCLELLGQIQNILLSRTDRRLNREEPT